LSWQNAIISLSLLEKDSVIFVNAILPIFLLAKGYSTIIMIVKGYGIIIIIGKGFNIIIIIGKGYGIIIIIGKGLSYLGKML